MYRFLFFSVLLTFISCSNDRHDSVPPVPVCEFDEANADYSVFDEKIDTAPEKIVAFGDIHGDMTAIIDVLYKSGIIDENLHWNAGETVLVQTGDFIDRGDDELEVLDYFEKLKGEAENRGGKFYTLNGNHEVMNVQGNYSYTSTAGFETFIEAGLPREFAFTPGGQCARYLSRNHIALNIAGNIFVHGGVFPEDITEGIPQINKKFSDWMRGIGTEPDDTETKIVWSRDYSLSLDCELLKQSLDLLGAKRMIVGHTIQEEVNSACEGLLFRIDTGMFSGFGGPRQAIVIENDVVSFIK